MGGAKQVPLGNPVGVTDDVQEKIRDAAPHSIFYDLVRAAAWSMEQDERNTLKDPTKVRVLHVSRLQQLIRTNLSVSLLSLPGGVLSEPPR